ncbi:MAG: tetraacyldisaccharide 4'-kinase [bacterium]|nr:tetraacyldisaccharide 4'-kinase [bacterium]
MPEKARSFIVGVMEDRRHGLLAGTLKCVLWGMSQVYRLGVWLRIRIYEAGLLRRRSLPCPTISVGNITVGGTGKTPFVEALASSLHERGRRVAILSRGYKSKNSPGAAERGGAATRVVSNGEKIFLNALHAGDEPYLLAANLKGVAVSVDKNRFRAGQAAISDMGADTLILDDGFQHLSLKRDLDIVLIDCTNPFGNGHLLPRGILREPLRALRRADCFVLTKATGVDTEPLRAKLRELNPQAEIIETIHQPLYLEELLSGRREKPEFIRGKAVHAVSGIARPDSFEEAVERLGGHIARRIRFTDHHRFTEQEIEEILQQASAEHVAAVVTTQKDAVRMPTLGFTPVPLYFLRVAIQVTKGTENLADWVLRLCQARVAPERACGSGTTHVPDA